MSFRRSKRSIKARKFYTAGNRADGRWEDSVEEASATAMSIRKEGSVQRQHIQWQATLWKEVDNDSDTTVVMKDGDSDATVVMKDDDDDEDTYLRNDEVHEESDASDMIEYNAKQGMYSTSGDEPNVKRSEMSKDMRKCNT